MNTVRFLYVWDSEKKEFFLARCFQRFGCSGHVVDNIGSGNGIAVFVDTETGRLTPEGAVNHEGAGDRYTGDAVHPNHHVRLGGMQIPRFREIRDTLSAIANANSYLRYLGFDVVVTGEGFKIIEINSLSSLDVTQQRKGFLADPRMRKFFER